RLWNLADQAPLGDPLPAHPGGVTAVACTALPDGTPIVVTGGHDGMVRARNLRKFSTFTEQQFQLPDTPSSITIDDRSRILVGMSNDVLVLSPGWQTHGESRGSIY
ncbi:WD40 repeat domain-containing protein, partial [Arthrobacter sp. Hiyo1]|uniref:WD40 repeat domain-containing protein n=1 Tax=Arthrobacter sp. Hiyo1 TaxID=1588020 RepID=UPI000AE37560